MAKTILLTGTTGELEAGPGGQFPGPGSGGVDQQVGGVASEARFDLPATSAPARSHHFAAENQLGPTLPGSGQETEGDPVGIDHPVLGAEAGAGEPPAPEVREASLELLRVQDFDRYAQLPQQLPLALPLPEQVWRDQEEVAGLPKPGSCPVRLRNLRRKSEL